MKKLILAAALLAPMAITPVLAQEIQNPYVPSPAPAATEAPREFTQRNVLLDRAAFRAERPDQTRTDRNAIPSSVGTLPY
ncbi:hypothetical protein [Phreatobacter sp.]|uniref:hypothetical protein n=1 Tax=Phreatobacter sp. TaxID=1966341 RepID=UPI003F724B7F